MAEATPLRILFVTGTLDIGGAETQMVRLAGELSRRGHEVQVLSMRRGGALETELEAHGVPWVDGHWTIETRGNFPPPGFFELPPWKRHLRAVPGRPRRALSRLEQIRRMWRLMAEFDPDVVHALLPGAYYTMMPGAWLQRVPGRVSGRRNLPRATDTRRSLMALTAMATVTGNLVVANSDLVADDVLSHEWIRPRRIEVIHNGVDLPVEATDVAGERPVGIVIANFQPAKGHLNLVAAMRLLDDPPVIRVLGDGVERPKIEAAIAEAALQRWLPLEGRVPGAAANLAAVQFSVQPSNAEALPNAVLEAMAAGVPVVATSVGGVPELIDDGVHGLLVPPNDPPALAAAIARITTDEALRVRLGAAARQRAAAFSWSSCVDRHELLYRDLVDRVGRRRVGSRRGGGR